MHMGKEGVGKGKGKDWSSSRSEQIIGDEFGAIEYDDEDELDEEDMEASVASEDEDSDRYLYWILISFRVRFIPDK